MQARLYGISISHPSRAARLMLEHKGIEYRLVSVSPGMQAVRVPLAGFRGSTVPALRIDGRRIVGTRAIARALEKIRPDPPLFASGPARRRAIEEAEAWGDEVLQPIPRRLLRWAIRHDQAARRRFARAMGMPFPQLAALAMAPVGAFYARREEAARTERIREDWEAFPAHLDHVDELIAAGTIGGADLNAADFQIATTLRVLLASADYGPLLSGRPGEDLARRVWPEYDYKLPPVVQAALA